MNRDTPADGDVLWAPAPDWRATSRVGPYMDWLEVNHDLSFDGHDELWQWSVDDQPGFWQSVWDYFEIESDTRHSAVLAEETMPGADWFPGATVNYTRHLITQVRKRPDEVAVLSRSQTRDPFELTFAELEDQVARARVGLKRLGVEKGDRVAGYLPNAPEALIAFLAAASLGAIWSSCAPEFGAPAVIDRFSQTAPKVLLVIGGYKFGDKSIDCTERVADIRAGLPSVEHTVAVPYGPYGCDGDSTWGELLAETAPLEFEAVEFAHPLFILFSSGTTGLPKAIVHGHGGILIEHLKSHHFSWDLGEGDTMLWFSTTAWMIWNSTVSALLVGASIVMVDGNPMYPDLNNQWRMAAETKATFMGLSPAFIMSCRKEGLNPAADHDLSSLRYLAAAGSPLNAEGFTWVHDQFGDQAPLNVGSGGTDVCTGIVQGNPTIPVYVGEMSGRCLGVAVYAFDTVGNEVVDELGELVITKPMPSMPVAFWGDTDGSRYLNTYFDQYPGVFRFGDWIRFTEHASCVITGRSDATLNRGGVRLGTAELYRVVEEDPRVNDSLVVHLEDTGGGGAGELILFVVARGVEDPNLHDDLRSALRQALSPRHSPDTVVTMTAVPRNMTGKKLELPVKKILQGAETAAVISRDAMVNPDSLDEYLAYAEGR